MEAVHDGAARRWGLVVALVLVTSACSKSHRTSAPPSTTTTTTVATTVAPTPTTSSPLTPIAGCPDPGPLAAPDPNRPRYAATATIDPVNATVTGDVHVTFVPDLDVTELVFRLWPNSPVMAGSGVHEEIAGAHLDDGTALDATQPDATTVRLALRTPFAAHTPIAVSLTYVLTVGGSNDDRVSHDGDTLRLGTFLPLLAWEPGAGWALDPPTSIHGEAATSTVSDYDVAIATPPGYDVLGTGTRGTDGHWRATAVRDVAFSVGHFVTAEADVAGVHVTVGVDRAVDEDPNRQLALIVDALPKYEGRFGAFPWPTYTVATTPGFHGGIEFPLHVMQAAGSATRSIVHELAHQWFYSLVGNDQARDPWLDEGLASYAEYVLVGSLATHAADPVAAAVRGHAGDPMTFWDHHAADYYAGLYEQSAVALASLGTTDQVDCALRQYVAREAFSIARPADVFAALAMVFPDPVGVLAPAGLHP